MLELDISRSILGKQNDNNFNIYSMPSFRPERKKEIDTLKKFNPVDNINNRQWQLKCGMARNRQKRIIETI